MGRINKTGNIDNFGLYVILSSPLAGYEKTAEAAVKCGVRYLQLRIKNKDIAEILPIAASLARITRDTDTLFIINDSVELARQCEANGVHLGQDDMSIPEARSLWFEDRIYGLSTHNQQQADLAPKGNPDYIGVGPVFATPTKAIPDPVLGLQKMGRIIESSSLPAVAIGGINRKTLPDVLKHGARNYAVVRDINQSRDPEKIIRELQDIHQQYKSEA